MTEKDMHNIQDEQYYRFIGISSKKKRQRIFDILSYCKEVRDTAYPMQNSAVTELRIIEFCARKDKDFISINGTMSLTDCTRNENRAFDAYIIEDKENQKVRVYMDITRLCVQDEPKMIRTTDDITEEEYSIITITEYATTDAVENKVFTSIFSRNNNDEVQPEKRNQLSAP